MKSVAVMFDVIESRRYNKRYDVQEIIFNCVQYLNWQYEKHIKKEVIVSAGDEFQGLFFDLQSAFAYIRELQLLIYPVKIRCGIGYGQIKYDVEQWQSTAFDGEAYYLCRDALIEVSSEKNNAICFNTSSKYDKYLNVFCKSGIDIKSKQSQIAHVIELLADTIYPLCEIDQDLSFISYVINQRARLIENETWNKVVGQYREVNPLNINYDYLSSIRMNVEKRMNVENRNNNSGFTMNDFWTRGMSTHIAEAMGTARQNIDRYISSGRIKESRTIDKAIFDLLGEIK